MRIFLTGVACVGKTTIGAKLADLLTYQFFDLDGEIAFEDGFQLLVKGTGQSRGSPGEAVLGGQLGDLPLPRPLLGLAHGASKRDRSNLEPRKARPFSVGSSEICPTTSPTWACTRTFQVPCTA
jgi:hypothetical protein